jgi:hypothetical protein
MAPSSWRLNVTTLYKTRVCKIGVRQLNEAIALTNTVVSSAFFITCLFLDTVHHSVLVIINFQQKTIIHYLDFIGYFVIRFVVQMDGCCQLVEWVDTLMVIVIS